MCCAAYRGDADATLRTGVARPKPGVRRCRHRYNRRRPVVADLRPSRDAAAAAAAPIRRSSHSQ